MVNDMYGKIHSWRWSPLDCNSDYITIDRELWLHNHWPCLCGNKHIPVLSVGLKGKIAMLSIKF